MDRPVEARLQARIHQLRREVNDSPYDVLLTRMLAEAVADLDRAYRPARDSTRDRAVTQ